MIRFLEGVLCGLLLAALGWDRLRGAVMTAIELGKEVYNAFG